MISETTFKQKVASLTPNPLVIIHHQVNNNGHLLICLNPPSVGWVTCYPRVFPGWYGVFLGWYGVFLGWYGVFLGWYGVFLGLVKMVRYK